MKEFKSQITILIITIVLLFILMSCESNKADKMINKRVSDVNGQVISVDEKSLYFSDNPFHWNGKGDRVYKFEYKVNGEIKTGWLRTRYFSEDWILDGKEE